MNAIAVNLIHAQDAAMHNAMISGDFASLERRAYGHMLAEPNGRKVRKPGLYDRKIATAKANAVEATYKGHSEGKRAIMLGCYGAKPQTDMQHAVARRMDQPSASQGALFFTERGDFTHLSGRGI